MAMTRRCEQPWTRASATKSRVFHSEHLAADHAGKPGPDEDGDRDGDGPQPLPQAHGEQQRDENRRERQRRVHNPHEEAVHAAAEVAGHDPHDEPDAAARQQGRRRHDQAHASAVDEPAQDVPAEHVGSEQVLGAPAVLPHGRAELVG
jgi:hypothetical protein